MGSRQAGCGPQQAATARQGAGGASAPLRLPTLHFQCHGRPAAAWLAGAAAIRVCPAGPVAVAGSGAGHGRSHRVPAILWGPATCIMPTHGWHTSARGSGSGGYGTAGMEPGPRPQCLLHVPNAEGERQQMPRQGKCHVGDARRLRGQFCQATGPGKPWHDQSRAMPLPCTRPWRAKPLDEEAMLLWGWAAPARGIPGGRPARHGPGTGALSGFWGHGFLAAACRMGGAASAQLCLQRMFLAPLVPLPHATARGTWGRPSPRVQLPGRLVGTGGAPACSGQTAALCTRDATALGSAPGRASCRPLGRHCVGPTVSGGDHVRVGPVMPLGPQGNTGPGAWGARPPRNG